MKKTKTSKCFAQSPAFSPKKIPEEFSGSRNPRDFLVLNGDLK